jgi:hypothetical protein
MGAGWDGSGERITELDPDGLGLLQDGLARGGKGLGNGGACWPRRPMMHLHLHRRRGMMICHDCRHRPRCGEGGLVPNKETSGRVMARLKR